MAKFTTNVGYGASDTIEAERFEQNGDYWYFYDTENRTVFVVAASKVINIQRLSE